MKVGNTAPEIEFKGDVYVNRQLVNNMNRLSDIKTKYKLVVFGGSWCPQCKEETMLLNMRYDKWKVKEVSVVKLPEGFNELYFYNDAGELRGNTKTIKVDGKDLAFITIHGDKPEQLTASIGSNNTKQATNKSFNFSSDAILGSIARPIVIELPKNEISIYPNPFQEELKVAINSKEEGEAKVTIYNLATSQTYYNNVFKVNAGANIFKLRPNVPAGAYVINVKIGELVYYNKVIKIN